MLTTASANADSDLQLNLSVLQWWVIIGSLLVGVLISVSRERQLLTSTTQVDPDSETTGRSDTSQQSKVGEPRKILVFAASGVFVGLLATISTQFPVVCTLGIVAISLFIIAIHLLSVFEIKLSSILKKDYTEQSSNSWRASLPVALVLAYITVWATSDWFGTNLASGDLQLVAGVVTGLVAGVIIGEFWTDRSKTDRPDDRQRSIRRVSGIAMIALAIYLAGRIPEVPVLFLWAVFLIVLSVYCGVTTKLVQPVNSERQLLKGAGIVMLIFGVIGLTSASFGYRNLNVPFVQISNFIASGGQFSAVQSGTSTDFFVYARSMDEFDQLLANAKQAGKPAAVDLYADWCLDCKRMDRTTFKDPSIVVEMTETFDSIKIDVTDPNDEFGRVLRKRFKVFGPPALLFFDRGGNISTNSPVYGYLDVDELTVLLTQVK